jgi:hypothetical protein
MLLLHSLQLLEREAKLIIRDKVLHLWMVRLGTLLVNEGLSLRRHLLELTGFDSELLKSALRGLQVQVLILGPLLVYVGWVHWLQEVLRKVGLGLKVLQGKLSFQLVL